MDSLFSSDFRSCVSYVTCSWNGQLFNTDRCNSANRCLPLASHGLVFVAALSNSRYTEAARLRCDSTVEPRLSYVSALFSVSSERSLTLSYHPSKHFTSFLGFYPSVLFLCRNISCGEFLSLRHTMLLHCVAGRAFSLGDRSDWQVYLTLAFVNRRYRQPASVAPARFDEIYTQTLQPKGVLVVFNCHLFVWLFWGKRCVVIVSEPRDKF